LNAEQASHGQGCLEEGRPGAGLGSTRQQRTGGNGHDKIECRHLRESTQADHPYDHDYPDKRDGRQSQRPDDRIEELCFKKHDLINLWLASRTIGLSENGWAWSV
jgi:hypothetical protein